MAEVKLLLPKMGESVAEATVTAWLKNEGDLIELEESILEIATDKVDSEVPCDYEGKLIKKLCQEGDVIKIGEPFAIVEVENTGNTETPPQPELESDIYSSTSTNNFEEKLPKKLEVNKETQDLKSTKFLSPLVKSIVAKENIAASELNTLQGTGREGRITKNDILSYVDARAVAAPLQSTPTPPATAPKVTQSISGASDLIEMDRMRKLIANHMVESKKTAPHVTSVVEIDVTNLVIWRNKVKDDFFKKEGYKLTFTPLFVEAVAKAIKDFPMINVTVEGDCIRVKKDANIGMAVALPSGNLIVPVVKSANNLNLMGMAQAVNTLALKARNNKLAPDDVKNGTFTITNIGTFGNIIGTPIINQPEVAILATGVIQKKPAVIETPEGDFIGIRQMMFMSMSYDHRVVDGMLGGSFLRKVGDYLENFDINRQIW